jgi:phosphoserine aminotransferase
MVNKKTYNFGAGPAKIPEAVMEKAQKEFLNYNGHGISILEMSHRSADFGNIVNSTKKLLRDEMQIPDNYEILLLHGGGTGQFAGIPLNLQAFSKNTSSPTADYAVTGTWSKNAAQEAAKYLTVKKVFDVKTPFVGPPAINTWKRDPEAAYLFYCSNETIHGVEYPEAPETLPGVPLVADVSSNVLSRKFDFTNHGIVFGGTQKNLGAAGLTLAIVREDLIGKQHAFTPGILSYEEIHKNNSLHNTPSTYSIYLTNLVLEWIRDLGGVKALSELSDQKSQLIYETIDNSDSFYVNSVHKDFRSRMNIPFHVGSTEGKPELEAEFLKGATARGMIGLKGHRSVGGIRASIYNSITLEETQTLVDYMKEFQASHSK